MGDFSAFHDLIMLCMERGDYACAVTLLEEHKDHFELSKLVGLFSEKLFAPSLSSNVCDGRLRLFEFLAQKFCHTFNSIYWGRSLAINFLATQTQMSLSFAQKVARIMIECEKVFDLRQVHLLATVMLPFSEAKEHMKCLDPDHFDTHKHVEMAVVDKQNKLDHIDQSGALRRFKMEYEERKKTLAREEAVEVEQVRHRFAEKKRKLEEEAEKKLKE